MSAAVPTRPFVWLKDAVDVGKVGSSYIKVYITADVADVADLVAAILSKFLPRWGQRVEADILLYFVSAKEGGKSEPDVAQETTALSADPLKATLTLEEASITPECFLLAKCTGAAVAGSSVGTLGSSGVEALANAVSALLMPRVEMAIARSKRIISEEAEAACSSSVVLLMDDNNVGVGCAIFISPTIAVTCFHNVEGHDGEVIPGMLEDGTRVNFQVRGPSTDDKALDIVSLEVHGEDARTVKHFLPLSTTALFKGQPAVVLSFQVAIQEELENSFTLGVVFVTSTVSKASKHHLLLQTATFRGDSGAAVVLADGKLIAMNVAGINAARERLKQWEDVEEDEGVKLRLTDVEASVDSLVGDLAQGSLAVRSSAFAHFLQ